MLEPRLVQYKLFVNCELGLQILVTLKNFVLNIFFINRSQLFKKKKFGSKVINKNSPSLVNLICLFLNQFY